MEKNTNPPHSYKGSRSLIDIYQQISLLECYIQIFEILAYNQIYPLISKGIPNIQHKFSNGRSTISNLALFSDHVLTQMEGVCL